MVEVPVQMQGRRLMSQVKDSQAVRENRFSFTLPFFLFRFSIDLVMPTHMEGRINLLYKVYQFKCLSDPSHSHPE